MRINLIGFPFVSVFILVIITYKEEEYSVKNMLDSYDFNLIAFVIYIVYKK